MHTVRPLLQEFALRSVTSPRHNGAILAAVPQRFAPAVADSDFCGLLHPTHPSSCNRHAAGMLPLLFSRSIMVYLPVYSASMLAVQRAKLLKSPNAILARMLLGMTRSSAFLAVYVAACHRGAASSMPPSRVVRLLTCDDLLGTCGAAVCLICYTLKTSAAWRLSRTL
jgi:hypothetical protein